MQIRRKTMKNSTTQIASEIIKYPVRKNLMKELQAPPLHKNPENSAGDRRAPVRSEALSGLGAARKAPSARPVALQVRQSPRSPSRCSGRPRQRLLKRVHSRRTGWKTRSFRFKALSRSRGDEEGFPGQVRGARAGPARTGTGVRQKRPCGGCGERGVSADGAGRFGDGRQTRGPGRRCRGLGRGAETRCE